MERKANLEFMSCMSCAPYSTKTLRKIHENFSNTFSKHKQVIYISVVVVSCCYIVAMPSNPFFRNQGGKLTVTEEGTLVWRRRKPGGGGDPGYPIYK